MGALTAYSITVAMILAIEYIVYKGMLATATFYRFNRCVLLGCYALALVGASAGSLFAGENAFMQDTLEVGSPGIGMVDAVEGDTGAHLLWRLIPIIYFAGVVVMAVFTLVSYVKMAKVIRGGERRKIDGATVIVAKSRVSPFSWGRYLVVSPEEADNHLILEHELHHIRRYHSLDLMVAQLFIIFNWFNPAAYLMRRELSAVHEYDVDSEILSSGADAAEYQMLLIKKTVGPGFQSIANSLNHSQLKNRLTMMLKSRSKSGRRLCAAALLPAAMLAVAMTDFPAVASTIGSIESVSYGKGSESFSSAQSPEENASVSAETSKTYETVEEMPTYPGGMQALMRAVMDEMKYPENVAGKSEYDGRVVISFTVKADGTTGDFERLKSCGYGDLDAEAIRAVKTALSKERWTPGKVDGKAVNVRFNLPVQFVRK